MSDGKSSARDAGGGNAGFYIAGIIVVGIVVAFIAYLIFQPPEPQRTSCIQMPELQEESIRKPAMDIAAELEGLQIDSELKANYEEITKTSFQRIGDQEVALLLLLRAIDCYIEKAVGEKKEVVEAIVPELVAMARASWASTHHLKGDSDQLSVKERDLIEASSVGDEILKALASYGIS